MSPTTDSPPWQEDVLARSRRLTAMLGEHLSGPADPSSPRAGRDQPQTALAGVSALLRDLLAGPPEPLRAVRRTNDALGRLRRLTSVADILRAAPAEVCAGGGFDRALVSRVIESTWLPVELHVVADVDSPANTALRAYIRHARIELCNGMLEAEVARRRAPALVTDTSAEPRTFPPLLEVAESRAFVVAPVIANGAVVGLLHADTHSSGRPLAVVDRDNLLAFADGLGVILERTTLVERLTSQREQFGRAFAAAEALVDDLCAAPVLLERPVPELPAPANHAEPGQVEMLTPREREVLALLGSGATNARIADQLSVSETTVKSHVKHILRKLRVANRAEAISHHFGGLER